VRRDVLESVETVEGLIRRKLPIGTTISEKRLIDTLMEMVCGSARAGGVLAGRQPVVGGVGAALVGGLDVVCVRAPPGPYQVRGGEGDCADAEEGRPGAP
jgi:hypothetical protein